MDPLSGSSCRPLARMGFWMVKESFEMTMGEATKTISIVQSIVGLVGLVMVLIMNLFPRTI